MFQDQLKIFLSKPFGFQYNVKLVRLNLFRLTQLHVELVTEFNFF